MTDDSYFNISEIKLFSVQIISYLGASDIIYSHVIDSFISEILKNELSVIQTLTEKPLAVLFTLLDYSYTKLMKTILCTRSVRQAIWVYKWIYTYTHISNTHNFRFLKKVRVTYYTSSKKRLNKNYFNIMERIIFSILHLNHNMS